MIEAVWEKREVLKVIVSDHLNTNIEKFLIEDEEWELLKMFADELLAFSEATQVFSKSKSITSPNVSGLLTRRDCEVIDFTRSRVKNNTELTSLGN